MIKKTVFFVVLIAVLFFFKGICSAQQKDGVVKEHYMTGELKSETMYKNGRKDGEQKIYHKNGRLEYKHKYKDGKLVSSYATEPERDLGALSFLTDFRIWGGVFGVCIICWFLFTKVIMRGKD